MLMFTKIHHFAYLMLQIDILWINCYEYSFVFIL